MQKRYGPSLNGNSGGSQSVPSTQTQSGRSQQSLVLRFRGERLITERVVRRNLPGERESFARGSLMKPDKGANLVGILNSNRAMVRVSRRWPDRRMIKRAGVVKGLLIGRTEKYIRARPFSRECFNGYTVKGG